MQPRPICNLHSPYFRHEEKDRRSSPFEGSAPAVWRLARPIQRGITSAHNAIVSEPGIDISSLGVFISSAGHVISSPGAVIAIPAHLCGVAGVTDVELPEDLGMASPAPIVPKVEVPSPKEVIELSEGEELDDPIPSGVAARADSSGAGPCAPRVAVPPDTSGDEEFARRLFVSLNRDAIGIPGDGALVDLFSVDDEEEEDMASSGGAPTHGEASPRSPPSA